MKSIVQLSLVPTLVFAFACSSSSGGGSSGNSCAFQAAGGGSASSACQSCAESSCGSDVSGYESSCSDFLSCICPGGTYNSSLTQQCASKAQESSCESAAESAGSCISQNCASQCNSGSGSGGGSGSGSGSGGGSGSSSGGGGGMVWCSFSGVVCENLPEASACTSTSGTVVSGCPGSTQNGSLVGCCTTGSTESCYYDAAITSSSCTMKGGTWSTTWSSTP